MPLGTSCALSPSHWARGPDARLYAFLSAQRPKDGFVFHATCQEGTLDVTIITNYDPAKTPELAGGFPGVSSFKKSEVMKAKELYPEMYEHFERVGNPVQRLEGLWASAIPSKDRLKLDT